MSPRKTKLDHKDRLLLSLVVDCTSISQKELSARLGIAQPSVALRLKRLRENGFLVREVGVDVGVLGLTRALVDMVTKDPVSVQKFLIACPYVIQSYVQTGRYNLSLVVAADDTDTIHSVMDEAVRSNTLIDDYRIDIIYGSLGPMVARIDLSGSKHVQPPCGSPISCPDCDSYTDGLCKGCPALEEYRGDLF